MRRRSDYPAFLALRGVGAALLALPRPLALAAGAGAGRAVWLAGIRRGVTDANLQIAFPDLSRTRRAVLAQEVYAHFARMTVDSLRLSNSGPAAVASLVSGGESADVIRDALKRGRGVIILTGHVGNWELAGSYIAAVGIPLSAVVKPPSNPYIAAHADAARRRLGIETIPMPEARSGVMHALRANRAVALVADQGALRSSIWSPFFGRPTKTPAGPGLFAVRSGAPVVFGVFVARGAGYELQVRMLAEEVKGDAATAGQAIADQYRAALEAVVRQVPEQYLWTHRLWKQAPPADRDPVGGR